MHDDLTVPADAPFDPTRASGVAAGREPRVGDVLVGRYRLDAELGRGGNALVFEAYDEDLGRSVALKALLGRNGAGTEGWQQLLDEARLQADVESPGVARLLDALRDGDRRYLVMDLVRGPELREVVERLADRALLEGRRPVDGGWLADAAGLPDDAPARAAWRRLDWDRTVATFGARLVEAVGGLHARGLVHRDLKPGNVKVDPRGEPVVLDFGLAGRLGDEAAEPTRGTPRYMGPEQLDERRHRRDPRTDVLQLGLVLFELLTLRVARDAPTLSEILDQVRSGRVPRVADVTPDAERGLAAVIDHATRPEPEARFAELAAFADDLRRVARGRAPRHTPMPAGYRLRRGLATAVRSGPFAAVVVAGVLATVAWFASSALEPELTSVEGWRYRPGEESLQALAPGSVVRDDDDLGVRVSSTERSVVYAVSVFGGDSDATQRVAPLYPLLLVDGRPVTREDASWGLPLEPGERQVLCARLDEPAPYEGLLVFAAREPVPLLEEWLSALDARVVESGDGVPHAGAFALLDTLRVPALTRGRRVDATATPESDARYASLDGAKAAGRGAWDLGADLVRFELLCRVAEP